MADSTIEMKRWNTANVNTPKYFDVIWPQWEGEGVDYNELRMKALVADARDFQNMVDLGAGFLGCAMYIADKTNLKPRELVAVDFSLEARRMTLERLGEKSVRLNYIIGNVTDTPLQSSRFDICFMGEIIEHMEYPHKLLSEANRILRVGGKIAISTVDMHCATAKRNGCKYPDHVWDFDLGSIVDMVALHFRNVSGEKVGNYYIVKGIK